MLDIELLENIYGDKINLDLFVYPPKDDADLINNYLPSKLWRLNNLYTIVDKEGEKRRFVMNYAQHRVYNYLLDHSRAIILKSRQQGISTFFLISYVDDLLFVDDLNVGMMAQGDAEAKTLLKRAKLAWNEFPQSVRDFLTVSRVNDNTQELSLSNGSTIFVRTSFRSTTLQRLHISEFGKIANANPARAEETITGTLQAIKAGNIVAIESTAEGDNLFKTMWDTAVERLEQVTMQGKKLSALDFYPVFLSWLDDPDCNSNDDEEELPVHTQYFTEVESKTGRTIAKSQRNFWIAKYRELGGKITQEYPATPDEAFQKTKDGTYYARAYREFVRSRGREVRGLYDHNLPVHVAMDLGMSDTMTLFFFQVFRGEVRIVHEYFNSGEGLEHYVNYMNKLRDTDGYDIQWLVCPHDIEVTELGTGISRKQRLIELGCTKLKVLPRLDIASGIERVRKLIPNLFIDVSCNYGIGCLLNYTKEWDDLHQVWKAKPLHDKWSHGADAIRYLAMAGFEAIPFYWESGKPNYSVREDFGGRERSSGFAI